MATSQEFLEFVCEQLNGAGNLRYRKMFGEYMIYINEKPVVLVCDNTVFIKKLSQLSDVMQNSECGYPYDGAKEHYILDIDDAQEAKKIVRIAEAATPTPKRKSRNK